MANQDYWSAVEEKGLRRNEITCAWFLVLAAVIILQIITSLAASPDCPAGEKTAGAQTDVNMTEPARENQGMLMAANQQPCGQR